MRGRKVHLVVINNVFPAHRDIHQTYDLKGSTVGREFDEAKLKDNPKGPLKDLNWINRGMNMHLGPRKKNLLMSQLKKDVEVKFPSNHTDHSYYHLSTLWTIPC
jgi:1-phosphatidylinositol-4-phosphate 5-kinase